MTAKDLQEQRAQVARELKYSCEDKALILRDLLDGANPDHIRLLADFERIELRIWYLKELKTTLHALRFHHPDKD